MRNNGFLKSIEKFITGNRLMDKKALYLSALSGGADSVALLLSLHLLGYKAEAVHCNFHLRGEESDRDERFCISLCKKYGIKIHIVHFDTKEYAKLHKVSIEMAARNLRYSYFERLRADMGAAGICVGHHREDSVETVLINLIRGTGINGLTGIAPKNGFIIRPMLDVSRRDIETFLKDEKQNFITDSTNLIDDVTRNKIRLNLMPLIREINPSADKDIAATAIRLSEAAKVFDSAISDSIREVVSHESESNVFIDTDKLKAMPSAEYTLFYILKEYGFSPATIENIHRRLNSAQCGKTYVTERYRLLLDRNSIIIEKRDGTEEREKLMKVPECGTYCFDNKKKFKFEIRTNNGPASISRTADVATLEAANIKFPLTIRTTKKGDWFVPFGMKGKKLVSDFLTDRKFTLFEKERQTVVEDASGNIIWISGLRTDNRYRIERGTQEILRIELKNAL